MSSFFFSLIYRSPIDPNNHGGSFEAAPINLLGASFRQSMAEAAAEDAATYANITSSSSENPGPATKLNFASPGPSTSAHTPLISGMTARQSRRSLGPDLDPESPLNPGKRIRVSDLHTPRYSEEFFELADVANGQYGQVKIVRHRLDGMVYAIKVHIISANRLS